MGAPKIAALSCGDGDGVHGVFRWLRLVAKSSTAGIRGLGHSRSQAMIEAVIESK